MRRQHLLAGALTCAMLGIGLFTAREASSMTIMPLSESQLMGIINEDRLPQDGLADGDIVLLRRFRREDIGQGGARVDFTMKVEEFLTTRASNVKQTMNVGDLILLKNTTLNPYLEWIDQEMVVAFLEKVNGDYVVLSMKAAPVSLSSNEHGGVALALRNPWVSMVRATNGSTQRQLSQTTANPEGSVTEKLDDFRARIGSR